jgi:hypothetical protein
VCKRFQIERPAVQPIIFQRFETMSRLSFLRCLRLIIAGSLAAVACASCNYGPSRIEPPSIDASGSADEAMELYDANDDGQLSSEELEKAPGLKAAIETVDTNKDGNISEDEIAERIAAWQASRIGVVSILCLVTMDGQPLEGATVIFEPESFLGEDVLAGDGTTDYTGAVYPRIPKEKRPVADMPGGMQLGFFRIKVSKVVNGKETIPAIYNSETTLGQQIAPDDPAFKSQRLRINLKSR